MDRKKILLYGVGTYKNRGVEAIVDTTLKLLDGNDITIASYDYENNKNKYADKVKYINHCIEIEEMNEKQQEEINDLINRGKSRREIEIYHQEKVLKEIKKQDICISVGGDNYCYKNNDWLYLLDEESKKKNKKLILWGASLYERHDDASLLNDMNLFDILLIRESVSYDEIKKFVPEEKLILAPDPAFSLEKEEVELKEFYKKSKVIGINLSPLTIPNTDLNDESFKEIINLIKYILKNTKYKVSLIPHVTTDGCNDMTTLEAIYKEFEGNKRVLLEDSDYNCRQIKYIISNCEMLIAARTHASIAAYSTCVPTLVVGYSVKSKGIAKDLFGTYENYVIPCDEIKEGNIIANFKWLDKNKKSIRKHLEDMMPNYKSKSKDLFKIVIERLENNERKFICPKNKCIGCGLCINKCPKNAITFKEDELGFKYPIIDYDKCVGCDLCRKNCPINSNEKKEKFTPICYAAKNKNSEIRKKSTSGGLFTIFAEKVISKKGVVYGAIKEGTSVRHIRVDSKEELEKIRGSKYAQSNILDVFEKVKEDINNNKFILLSGTPCQIAAFKKIIGNYKNVLLISVICHGVINEKITNKYLEEEFKNQTVKSFDYRTKENGWSNASIKVETDKFTRIEKFGNNTLMGLFNLNEILRDSCYSCNYKGDKNVADIVLGDYWGVGNFHNELFDEEGVSALIINSKVGEEFIKNNNILDKTIHIKSSMKNVEIGNPVFYKSAEKNMRRYTISNDIETMSLKQIYALDHLKEELKSTQIRLNEVIDFERNRRIEVEKELTKVYNSKRWKITDKIFNFIGRIRKR